jgi:hypothetical protein
VFQLGAGLKTLLAQIIIVVMKLLMKYIFCKCHVDIARFSIHRANCIGNKSSGKAL